MTPAAGALDEVGAAADALVAAFAAHDVTAYFDAFDPDATFLFHSSPRVLGVEDRVRGRVGGLGGVRASGFSAARPAIVASTSWARMSRS